MPSKPKSFHPRGLTTRAEQNRVADAYRGTAQQRGYDADWRRARTQHLREFPLCAYCELDGRVTAATVVDHLYPHGGDRVLFWLRHWWVSTCAPCHSGFKQSIERAGRAAIDALALRLGLPAMGEGGVKSLPP